jgi:hypothetical protein
VLHALISAAKLLTKDEARRIAANIAKLNRLRQNFSRPRLFVASHGYHHGEHEPGNQDSEHNRCWLSGAPNEY